MNDLPNNTDELFKEETNPAYGAWLKVPTDKFFLYSEGYREAGQQLWDICSKERFYWNSLVYPLIHNYRQFVELRLKELMIMGYKYLDINKDFADIHDLMKLWRAYKDDILKKVETIDDDILNNVERLIKQFQTEDPKSMSFRYPVSKGPIRKVHLTRQTIDLLNFKEVIDKLIHFLDWQWDMLTHYTDMKSEVLADMYREYYW